jgi:SAM-dependent methyltransferase
MLLWPAEKTVTLTLRPRVFFEHWLSTAPAPTQDDALRWVFAIGGSGGTWALDGRDGSWRVEMMPLDNGDCRIELDSPADLAALASDPLEGQRLYWQGRLRARGRVEALERLPRLLSPDRPEAASQDGYYHALARLLPSQRFVFMNHGYDDGTQVALEPQDEIWRYPIQMLLHVLAGEELGGRRVLDVGCGRGGSAAFLARNGASSIVVGLDRCKEAVARCVATHCAPQLHFLCGDAMALPFHDEAFDVVINIESSHCYSSRAGFFVEVARVLRPGGAFCYADNFVPEDLAAADEALRSTPGLRVRHARDITAEVERGIVLGRQRFADLLDGMRDDFEGNAAIIDNLLFTVNEEIPRRYRAREWLYHSFHAVKAA